METRKTYTKKQLDMAARALMFFSSLPDKERESAIQTVSAFIAGMEAQNKINARAE